MKKEYWLYLEPYTFCFHNENKVLIYNTINSSYLLFPLDNPTINHIVNELDNSQNGYGVVLKEEDIKSLPSTFIQQIKETFSGDIIINKNKSLPFLFKPMCRIMEKRLGNEKEIIGINSEILSNLNEVTVYIGKNNQRNEDYPYHQQFIHSMYSQNSILEDNDYHLLFHKLDEIGIEKLNIVNNDGNLENRFNLEQYHFKIDVYIDFNDEYLKLIESINNPNIHIIINVHGFLPIQNEINKFYNRNIEWNLIVDNEKDLYDVQQLNGNVKITPYYNGKNISFFEKYIFNDLDAILDTPIDKQTIFRRQHLNEIFFGKIFIIPDGDVYANLNCQSIGNIKRMPLSEIIFNEMSNSTIWFKLREEGICKKCLNKYLCPSISNYELVLQRNNLCHID